MLDWAFRTERLAAENFRRPHLTSDMELRASAPVF
jgi:hypothetical protein